jgi:hypothetical protein
LIIALDGARYHIVLVRSWLAAAVLSWLLNVPERLFKSLVLCIRWEKISARSPQHLLQSFMLVKRLLRLNRHARGGTPAVTRLLAKLSLIKIGVSCARMFVGR